MRDIPWNSALATILVYPIIRISIIRIPMANLLHR